NYDSIVKTRNSGESSNNKKFNENLERIVDQLM
ncbi:glycosyltransferase, partial [Lactobacillus delbrueckii subsp. bulgaricus]|nr:glycosyltransferase [Lactobacillus delbrueckii subsp. bulgaricus]